MISTMTMANIIIIWTVRGREREREKICACILYSNHNNTNTENHMQEKCTAKHTLPIDSGYQFKELPTECIRWTRFSFAGTTFIAMSSKIMRQICTYTRRKSTSFAVTYSKQWNFSVLFRYQTQHVCAHTWISFALTE